MRIFIAEDLINTFECGKFGLFIAEDVNAIIDAIKVEAKEQKVMNEYPKRYIDADAFIGKILNGEYIHLQHIKYELAGAIDMFYNVFGLESDE